MGAVIFVVSTTGQGDTPDSMKVGLESVLIALLTMNIIIVTDKHHHLYIYICRDFGSSFCKEI